MAKKENTSSNPKTTNQTSKIGDAVNKSLPDFKHTPKPPKKDSEGK